MGIKELSLSEMVRTRMGKGSKTAPKILFYGSVNRTRKRSPSRARHEHDEALVEHLPNREWLLQICRAHCKGKNNNKILFFVLREFKNILRDDLAIDDLKTGLRKVDDRLYDLMNSETLKAAEAYAKENLQESKVRGPQWWDNISCQLGIIILKL
jgi:hypothetical protein